MAEAVAVVVLGASSNGSSSWSSGRAVILTVDEDDGGAPLVPACWWTLRCDVGLPSVPMSAKFLVLHAQPIVKCFSHQSPSCPFCDGGIDVEDGSGYALFRRAEDSAWGGMPAAAAAAASSKSVFTR